MPAASPGRLIVLSGPSCVGKSPLARTLAKFHPDLFARLLPIVLHNSPAPPPRTLAKFHPALFARLLPIVLHNSRDPRPGERDGVDYHFRTRSQIEVLRHDDRYAVLDVRGDL